MQIPRNVDFLQPIMFRLRDMIINGYPIICLIYLQASLGAARKITDSYYAGAPYFALPNRPKNHNIILTHVWRPPMTSCYLSRSISAHEKFKYILPSSRFASIDVVSLPRCYLLTIFFACTILLYDPEYDLIRGEEVDRKYNHYSGDV